MDKEISNMSSSWKKVFYLHGFLRIRGISKMFLMTVFFIYDYKRDKTYRKNKHKQTQ